MRISDWSSDVCSSDLVDDFLVHLGQRFNHAILTARTAPNDAVIAAAKEAQGMFFAASAARPWCAFPREGPSKRHLCHAEPPPPEPEQPILASEPDKHSPALAQLRRAPCK